MHGRRHGKRGAAIDLAIGRIEIALLVGALILMGASGTRLISPDHRLFRVTLRLLPRYRPRVHRKTVPARTLSSRSGCVRNLRTGSGPLNALKRSHERPLTPGLPIEERRPKRRRVWRTCTDRRPRVRAHERYLSSWTKFKHPTNASILEALTSKGYTQPTPIQLQAIPGAQWEAATCSASAADRHWQDGRLCSPHFSTASRRTVTGCPRTRLPCASRFRRRVNSQRRSPRASRPMARSSASPSPLSSAASVIGRSARR